MIVKLITATGREIDVYNVIKGAMIDYLHIYITDMPIGEIYDLFTDSSETERLTVVKEDEGQEEGYSGTGEKV